MFQTILNRFRPKKFFRPKCFTFVFFRYFGHFDRKTTKSHEKNFTREKIFDFEIFALKYVLKHSESIPTKKNFRPKFFDFVIFSPFLAQKQSKNGQKRPKMKIFDQNFWKKIFFSESIQNVSKRILNWKSRNRKFFSCKIFCSDLVLFRPKKPKIVKKMTKWQKKFWSKNYFGMNRFRMLQNVF